MTVRPAVSLACVTCLGAFVAVPVPFAAILLAGICASIIRRWWVMIIAVGLCASAMAADQWTALDEALPDEADGVATIVRDPDRINGAVRAEVSLDDRRFQVWARDEAGHELARGSVGMQVDLHGRVAPLSGLAEPSLRRRHVAGRIDAEAVRIVDSGNFVSRAANSLRDLLKEGAGSLSEQNAALYSGLVTGDDREQQDDQREAFRESGLSHLLAVSGQNVAFLLLILQPLSSRLPLAGRLALGVGALVLFGFITRWEPSVIRAVVMALVVLFATHFGRDISPWRTLSFAVTICVLVDPFLVGSIGFLLSVGACCGIAALARPLSGRLPGPRALRVVLAVTISAQLGVAPVQLVVFGPMPAVAVVTNLFAAPCAAFVMMWGMTAGIVAGIVGAPVDVIIHWPTSIVLDSLTAIAEWGAHGTIANRLIGDWGVVSGVLVGVGLIVLPVRHPEVASPDDRAASRLSGEGRRSVTARKGSRHTARRDLVGRATRHP